MLGLIEQRNALVRTNTLMYIPINPEIVVSHFEKPSSLGRYLKWLRIHWNRKLNSHKAGHIFN